MIIKNKIFYLLLICAIVFGSVSPVFATEDPYSSTKTFWGYSTDYGTKAWRITTTLNVFYSGTSSTAKKISKIDTTALNDYDHSDDDLGNGTYGFIPGISTYSGSTKLGTIYPSSCSVLSVIYYPSIYLYFAKTKTVSYTIPAGSSGKVVGNYSFSNPDWTPVNDWFSELTNSIN